MKKLFYPIPRFVQTSTNCGPNSLAQLLHFYGNNVTPEEVKKKTRMIEGMGTYDGHLGVTAIKYGFHARLTPVNMYAFDPTWHKLPKEKLIAKLRNFKKTVKETLLKESISSYITFLSKGGNIEFKPLSKELLYSKLEKHPILIGLCSTYLYHEPRIRNSDTRFRLGHFVVVNGYDPKQDKFSIVDPWHSIPFSKTGRYQVKTEELIAAMYLGEATYDCAILEIM